MLRRRNARLIRFHAKNESAGSPRNSADCGAIDQVRRWTIGFAPKKRFARSKQSTRHWKTLFRRAIRPRTEAQRGKAKLHGGSFFTNGDTAQVIMPNRDPRIDPQRGDMVRGNGQVRCVMAREGDRVRCASGQYDYRMRLDNWQKWCRLNGATAGPGKPSRSGIPFA
jgi:hypothetical protein